MKCPECDGYKNFISLAGTPFEVVRPCKRCNGTGEIDVEITNEEWIKSLDTEGLVDFLYEVHKGGNSVERQRWIEKHKERVKMQFRGWLKEKHKE